MKKNIQVNSIAICLLLVGTLSSCENKVRVTPSGPPKEELQHNVIAYGDTNAYSQLFFYYYGADLLPYAVLMSDKYHYPKAYYDVYSLVDYYFDINHIDYDSATSRYILYYLREGLELKEEGCAWALCALYLTGDKQIVNIDTVLAKKCLESVFPQKKVEKLLWPYMKKTRSGVVPYDVNQKTRKAQEKIKK